MLAALLIVLSAGPAVPLPVSTVVEPRARGYLIETTAAHGAPVLKAGDRIDVIAVVTDPDAKVLKATMLLQNVTVLSNEAGYVKLHVLPEEAELLSLARAAGALSFITRNPGDPEVLEEHKRWTLKAMLALP